MSTILKTVTAAFAAAMLALAPVAAQAATPGIGDKTNAVRYGNAAPFGTKIDFTQLNTEDGPGSGDLDDNSTNVEAAFPLNFFGTKYERVCFSINGGVYPTNDDSLNCSVYDLDVATLAGDNLAPMVAVLASDTDLSKCDATRGTYDGGANTLTTPNDGWAEPCSVYVGETTVDGDEAIVVTWYRVSQFEDENDPSLYNTYQLLLIKRSTGSDADGWDFDFEFNYATLEDDEDGYAVDADSGLYIPEDEAECDAYDTVMDENGTPDDSSDDTVASRDKTSEYDLCRWGIGVGNYTVDDGGTVGYEFFEQYGIGDLIDTGDTAMIKHSLGSDVLGRYRCSMINGEARGCDFSAELADTGTEANDFGLVAAGLIAAGGIAVAVRRRKA